MAWMRKEMKDLQVGQEIVLMISSRWYANTYRKGTVTRVTKTTFQVELPGVDKTITMNRTNEEERGEYGIYKVARSSRYNKDFPEGLMTWAEADHITQEQNMRRKIRYAAADLADVDCRTWERLGIEKLNHIKAMLAELD